MPANYWLHSQALSIRKLKNIVQKHKQLPTEQGWQDALALAHVIPSIWRISMNLRKLTLALIVPMTMAMGAAQAKTVAQLNDLEMGHAAYTANIVDIRYAHLALAISKNPAIRNFARTMIRDHSAVNDQAAALFKKLKAQAKNNFFSRQLGAQSDALINKMSGLRGKAFDRFYAQNELRYHRAVNSLVEKVFIPNAKNPSVKALFKSALATFKVHEKHAEMMVKSLQK